jgi:hypothetical protein
MCRSGHKYKNHNKMTSYISKFRTLTTGYKKINRLTFLFILFFCTIETGCKKFVEIDPPTTAITSATVYANDLSAASAETSIYDNMAGGGLSTGLNSISCLAGLTSDEFENYNSSNSILSSCYSNTLVSTNTYFWNELFNEIYMANAVLEGLSSTTGVTLAEKNQLTGEAKFMRAFLHFYGTNLFGNFPVVTTTDYLVNNTIYRNAQPQVYQQIIADLKDAQSLLSDNFVTPTGGMVTSQRVRPNKGAATALLARAYLYQGYWDSAETQASTIIGNSSLYNLDTLNGVFLANSTEAIWQLQPVTPGFNTLDAYSFVLTGPPNSNNPVALTSGLINTFEAGDNRRTSWVDSISTAGLTYYYPFKYKVYEYSQQQPLTEYLMVLRLAEQYLIRAEAEAQLNDLTDAVNDLNIIRKRAGLGNTMATTQSDLLTAIYHERRAELFTEWGHRWFDLIRTDSVNSVMSVITPQKGGSWTPDWALFPIPQSEITINPNLTQNPGYQP